MKKKKKKSAVRRTDIDKVRRKLDELGGSFFKAREGKNIVRILPPWNDEGVFYYEASLHYGLKNEGRDRAYPCLTMYENDCPVCDFISGLSSKDKELKDKLAPRKKFYVNIIDRQSGNLVIWGFSTKILRTLLGYIQDPDWGDFTDPEEGHDIVIEREGTGRLDTKYEVRIKPKPTEVNFEDWEDEMHDLSEEIIDEISEEDLQEIVEDNYGETTKKKKGKKKDEEDEEDEDDEEDEEDEDEDDEEDKDEDDDDEEEEDDDDEEDEEEDDDDDEDEGKKKKLKKKKKKGKK